MALHAVQPMFKVRRLQYGRSSGLRAINQNFVPVVDDQGSFIGIITRKSIIKYCYNEMKAAQKSEDEKKRIIFVFSSLSLHAKRMAFTHFPLYNNTENAAILFYFRFPPDIHLSL